MKIEFRDDKTLVIKPESGLEQCLLEKLDGVRSSVVRQTYASSMEVVLKQDEKGGE